MQPLNHGSMWPTRLVASARYTRGSIDDGPGVSIKRFGGTSSPTCCVMILSPLFELRLPWEPHGLLPVGTCHYPAGSQFSRNRLPHAMDKLAVNRESRSSEDRLAAGIRRRFLI